MTQASMKMAKDEVLTFAAIALLFLTALVNWTLYSWLILIAVALLLVARHLRNGN